jgi:hypothetical protein
MPRKRATAAAATSAVTSTAAASSIVNAALPASTGGSYRTAPRFTPWSLKSVERIQRTKDIVQISRFLQSEEGIPQVRYGIRQLPREAVGKGIGCKSISTDLDFRRESTALFKKWAESPAIDIRKEHNLFALQPMLLASMLGDGELFIHPVYEPTGAAWSLNDRSRRAFQLQLISRDQLTNGTLKPEEARSQRWIDGLQYNGLDQLVNLRLNQDAEASGFYGSQKYTDLPAVNALGHRNIFHLKDPTRIHQYHGDPVIFASGRDLLDSLDLKALRKHSAKVRASLLGATTTRDGKMLNAMQQIAVSEQSGTPAADTGRRFVEVAEGAVFLPMSDNESFNFFNNPQEGIPFRDILADLLHPFMFELGYPPEWIFTRGKVGGVEYRGLLQQVARAHEGLRARLYPFLEWLWEKVIGTAMMPGGPLAQFAAIPDWNQIDFVTDPDPTVDAGRDNRADLENLGENLITPDDFIERRTGNDGEAVRRASIDQKLDSIRYAIHRATAQPIDQVEIPASIAIAIAMGLKTVQAASGIINVLNPTNIAADIAEMDAPAEPPPL